MCAHECCTGLDQKKSLSVGITVPQRHIIAICLLIVKVDKPACQRNCCEDHYATTVFDEWSRCGNQQIRISILSEWDVVSYVSQKTWTPWVFGKTIKTTLISNNTWYRGSVFSSYNSLSLRTVHSVGDCVYMSCLLAFTGLESFPRLAYCLSTMIWHSLSAQTIHQLQLQLSQMLFGFLNTCSCMQLQISETNWWD